MLSLAVVARFTTSPFVQTFMARFHTNQEKKSSFFLQALFCCARIDQHDKIPYRLDIYELLNRTSSRIVRVAAASGLAHEFRIVVISPKVKIKNSTSSVYREGPKIILDI